MEYMAFITMGFVACIMAQQAKQEKAIRQLDEKMSQLLEIQKKS